LVLAKLFYSSSTTFTQKSIGLGAHCIHFKQRMPVLVQLHTGNSNTLYTPRNQDTATMEHHTTGTLNRSHNLGTATMAPQRPPPVHHTSDDANETIYWNIYRRSIIPPVYDEPPAYLEPPAYVERPVEPQAIEAGLVTYEERVHQPQQPQPQPQQQQQPQLQMQLQQTTPNQRGRHTCFGICAGLVVCIAAIVVLVLWIRKGDVEWCKMHPQTKFCKNGGNSFW
jgi:hypothetical protein